MINSYRRSFMHISSTVSFLDGVSTSLFAMGPLFITRSTVIIWHSFYVKLASPTNSLLTIALIHLLIHKIFALLSSAITRDERHVTFNLCLQAKPRKHYIFFRSSVPTSPFILRYPVLLFSEIPALRT